IVASGYHPAGRLSCEEDALCLFRRFLRDSGAAADEIEGVVLASVVPEKTLMIRDAAARAFCAEPVLISGRTNWEFDTSAYSGVLGTDRLLCCSAALRKYTPPLIVVDFGTATTLNIINADGAFAGGVILPGITTGLRALAAGTSQLPDITFFELKSAIGTNTAECMLSGATFGAAFMLEGFRKRMEQELGAAATLVVTGGNAKNVIPYCNFEFHYEPELLLEGLAFQSGRLRNAAEEKEKIL
ncbi:MAG: type III pantothenate kinase, partial [Clostridiales bacterium]|nr:type III pantothenate kinase [Clostridiales bacterium]